MAIAAKWRMRKESSALAVTFSFWLCAMFRRNSFRRCNPLDAMRNIASNSDSPAGYSSVRTAHTSTRSRFRTSFSQTCLGAPSHHFYDGRDSQAKRTYRIHSRRNSHPRRPWAHEGLLRVLSDHQRSPRQLHRVRHLNHRVDALPAADADVGQDFGKAEDRLDFKGGALIGVGPRLNASDDFQGTVLRRSRGQLMQNRQVTHRSRTGASKIGIC